jgi:hypothetical protein
MGLICISSSNTSPNAKLQLKTSTRNTYHEHPTRRYYSKSGWESHGVNQFTWIDIVQRVFSTTKHGDACFDKLKAAVAAVAAAGATPAGRTLLAAKMHLCSQAVLGADPTNFLIDALETLPQEDYPYAIGSLPAWPGEQSASLCTCAPSAQEQETISFVRCASKRPSA